MINARIFDFCDQACCLREVVVTQENGDLVTPYGVYGSMSATSAGLVNNIIMNQRCQMDHFKGDTEQEQIVKTILIKFACEQGQGSTQALARRRKSMHRGGIKYGKSRRSSLLKSTIYLIDIRLDIS